MIILTPDTAVSFEGRDESPTDGIVVREMWIENVYRLSEDDFADTGVLIDIGANIGAVSVWAATRGASVIAIEPEPENHSYLVRNLDRNAPAGWQALQWAVCAESGRVNIIPSYGASRVSSRPGEGISVEAVTLEQVYETCGVTYSDVLKIDVEGSEYDILMSSSLDVLKKSRKIVVEFDAATDAVFGAAVAKLAHDFHVEILGSPERGGYLYCQRY